jgi:hypothetical protein
VLWRGAVGRVRASERARLIADNPSMGSRSRKQKRRKRNGIGHLS